MTNDYRAALEGAALFDFGANAKIEISGPDTRSFLHNLCTQDVKNLPVGSSVEAFLTTNKARILAHVWITHREPDVVWIDARAGMAEKIFQHLNHYLISEKAELADRTGEFAMLRLVGPKAAAIAAGFGVPVDLKPWQTTVTETGLVRRQNLLGLDGFDFFCPSDTAAEFAQRLLAAGATQGTPATYDILRIEAGLPEYGRDLDENRLAMEAGRTAQAISYNKGCYLGQETIVMARDRGQVNRQLLGVKLAGDTPPADGAKLFKGSDEVGQLTSTVFSPRLSQLIGLAFLRRGSWDAGTELVVDPSSDGRTAVVAALPFCG